jgi:hypothetical protein
MDIVDRVKKLREGIWRILRRVGWMLKRRRRRWWWVWGGRG